MTKEIYIPVCVTVDDGGHVVSASVDAYGAPWMYSDSQENVWSEDEQEWVHDDDAEIEAEGWLVERLRGAPTLSERLRSAGLIDT